MNSFLQKTSNISLDTTVGTGTISPGDDNDSGSDFCRNFQQRRRKSQLVEEDDVGPSSDSDEESDFCSSNRKLGRRNSELAPLDEGSASNLSLSSWYTTSWASEMSLYDKLTPGGRAREMANVRFPRTPPAISTPQEFKGFNWKQFDSNRSLLSLGGSARSLPSWGGSVIPENDVIAEEFDGEKLEHKREVYNGLDSCTSELSVKEFEIRAKTDMKDAKNIEPFAPPLKFDDDEQSELSATILNRSESESHISCGEIAIDHKNLLVNYLPPEMNSRMLEELFSSYGTIVHCKVVVDQPSGFSKGYGFVKFQTETEGKAARQAVHRLRIGKKTLKVSYSRRTVNGANTKHRTNLYISNLDPKMDSDDLERHFRVCGYVVQCKVLKNTNGVSKQIAFVRFDNSDSAQRAIDRFNGKQLEGTDRPISIRIAKTPRVPSSGGSPSSLVGSFTYPHTPPRVNAKSSACYVSGFDVSLSEKVLRRIFAAWEVRSIRIIRRLSGPYAFVNFYKSEDAAAAAITLNNTKLRNFTLTVRLKM